MTTLGLSNSAPIAGRIRSHRSSDARVVKVEGRLTRPTALRLVKVLRGAEPTEATILDLRQVTALDSVGTGVVVAAAARARRQGQPMVVVAAHPSVLGALEYVGLNLLVPVVVSLAAAHERLGPPAGGLAPVVPLPRRPEGRRTLVSSAR